MIISDKFKFVYVDVPKTGSVSFERSFRENFSGKTVYPNHSKKLSKHCREIPEHAKDYTTVVSVRNPYTRAISLYSYHLRVTGTTTAEYSFENFLDMIIDNQEKYEWLTRDILFNKKIITIKESKKILKEIDNKFLKEVLRNNFSKKYTNIIKILG